MKVKAIKTVFVENRLRQAGAVFDVADGTTLTEGVLEEIVEEKPKAEPKGKAKGKAAAKE